MGKGYKDKYDILQNHLAASAPPCRRAGTVRRDLRVDLLGSDDVQKIIAAVADYLTTTYTFGSIHVY